MRAVNLIPGDAKGGARGRPGGRPRGPALVLVGLLGVALAFVTIYVLASNTINQRTAKIASIRVQVAAAQAQAARLSNYAQFVKLAQSRAATIRQIVSSRFDWHAALADLSEVVPANTSLQSLLGTVAPGVTVTGPGGSAGGSAATTATLRAALPAPAFELRGCTANQDDVARLMSRLRLVDGVTRVTLADSLKQDNGQSGASVASSGAAGATGAAGCGTNAPTFDLVVFFQPLPGASASAPGTAGAAGAAGTAATRPATAASSTTPGSTPAPTQQQASTTSTSSSQPVSNSGAAGGGSK